MNDVRIRSFQHQFLMLLLISTLHSVIYGSIGSCKYCIELKRIFGDVRLLLYSEVLASFIYHCMVYESYIGKCQI
jgi:hypothetical protein